MNMSTDDQYTPVFPQEFVDSLNHRYMPQMGYALEGGVFWVHSLTGRRVGANEAGRQALKDGPRTRFKAPRSDERVEDIRGRGSEGL